MKSTLCSLIALVVCVGSASADSVTSVVAGAYTDGATWSDGQPPAAGNDYEVRHRVNSTGNTNVTLAGDSLTIVSGGTLRREQTNNKRRSLTTPPVTLDGGWIQFTGQNQYSRTFDFESDITVAGDSSIVLGRYNPQFDYFVFLNGALNGSADIEFRGYGGNSADDQMYLHVTTAANTFSGDWNLWSNDTGGPSLYADAANALGSGTVTLGVRSYLELNATNGIDSLAGVVLDDAGARLLLRDFVWSNNTAVLTMNDGTLDLGAADSRIAEMTIAGNPVSPGIYTAAQLTTLGHGGTFAGTGTLTVRPGGPSASVQPDALDFSNVATGLTENLTLVVSNVGDQELTIDGFSTSGVGAAAFTVVESPAAVAPGAASNIVVAFAPTALTNYTASLEIDTNDPDHPTFTIPLSGTGTGQAPEMGLPTALDFGLVSLLMVSNRTVSVTNTGGGALTLSDVVLGGAHAGQYAIIGGYPSTVEPGGVSNIVVQYHPDATGVLHAAELVLTSNADGSPHTVSLSGTGGIPDISATPDPLDFGSTYIYLANDQAVTVSNAGPGTLDITNVVLSGSDTGQFSVVSSPDVVTAGSTADVVVRYQPNAITSHTAILEIYSNDPDENPVDIALQGECPDSVLVSVAGTDWLAPETWINQAPPAPGLNYKIDGETVKVPNNSDQTFPGGSLTVTAGQLQMQSDTQGAVSATVTNFTLSGGQLRGQSGTYKSLFHFHGPVHFTDGTTSRIQLQGGNYDVHMYLYGELTGSGNADFVVNRQNDGKERSYLYVTRPDSSFSGDWTVWGMAPDRAHANLSAEAANALGSGTVTLSTMGALRVDATNGIDSIAGVTMTATNALLQLTHAWDSPSAWLAMDVPGTLDLVDATSAIGTMTIAGNDVASGTYDAAALTALGHGGAFAGSGTITVVGPRSPGTLLIVR